MSLREITPQAAEPVAPCVMLIGGDGGDLSRRKFIPAICHLVQQELLSDSVATVAVNRAEFDAPDCRVRSGSAIAGFLWDDLCGPRWRALLTRRHGPRSDPTDSAADAGLAGVLPDVGAARRPGMQGLRNLSVFE